jgi:hypothetical protein
VMDLSVPEVGTTTESHMMLIVFWLRCPSVNTLLL